MKKELRLKLFYPYSLRCSIGTAQILSFLCRAYSPPVTTLRKDASPFLRHSPGFLGGIDFERPLQVVIDPILLLDLAINLVFVLRKFCSGGKST
jgi:hypothetical protein